jgi:hypothetical protein
MHWSGRWAFFSSTLARWCLKVILESRIARAKLMVWDIDVNVIVMAILHILFIGETGISDNVGAQER